DKLIVGNIAATDYFMFDKAFGKTESKNDEIDSQPEQSTGKEDVTVDAPQTPATDENLQAGEKDVSRYHDEKMPYSFLWWLDKARKEHAGIYRPFATPVSSKSNLNTELEQQYYEN